MSVTAVANDSPPPRHANVEAEAALIGGMMQVNSIIDNAMLLSPVAVLSRNPRRLSR